jgi:protein-disulfide isomerase
MSTKRKVEVFTAGCPLCDDTVKMVNELTCPSCDVTVYNLNESGAEKAKEYGINSVPTVVVNGKILDCCKRGAPTREALQASGIGTPL